MKKKYLSPIIYSLSISLLLLCNNCSIGTPSGDYWLLFLLQQSTTRSWTFPNSLDDSFTVTGSNVSSPQTAMDSNGNRLIVWRQSDGASEQTFLSEYRASSWTHPTSLSNNISPDGADVSSVQVAMDDNGNAVIVWLQDNLSANRAVFMSEYRNGVWTHPATRNDNINVSTSNAFDLHLAMSPNGEAIIVYNQHDGSDQRVMKSEYRSGSWTHAASVAGDSISLAGDSALEPRVSMDSSGNTLISWRQNDGANIQIYKSEYRSGGWTHPANAADNISPAGTTCLAPRNAMDDAGNAMVVWRQLDGSQYQIFKSEYRSGAWTHPASLTDNISPDGTIADYPALSMNDLGQAIITWKQNDGSDYQIFKSEYLSGVWTHPASVTDNISVAGSIADAPAVSLDNLGQGIIVWQQMVGAYNQVFKSEYRSGFWTHPSALSDNISLDGSDGDTPRVSQNNQGSAIITWEQSDGSQDHGLFAVYE